LKVVICGGVALESQANAQIRQSIKDGWVELIGEENVITTHISGAPNVVAALRPNIVLGIGSYLPETVYFTEVAREAQRCGAATVFWATEDPYEKDASYRIEGVFDVIFSCDRWGARFYEHPQTYHLPLAGCGQRHFVPWRAEMERPIDILFCGVAFSSRQEIIEDIRGNFAGLNVSIIGPGWGRFGAGFSDRRIEKDQLVALYSRAKIILNLGRSLHFDNKRYMIAPSTPGPRTFEAALAGSVQFFHEDTLEMGRYFTSEELPCFSNPSEFGSLLQRFLASDALRSDTARRAQARARSEHTYMHRARRIIEFLQSKKRA
jgi:spore maturation protein CgeB